MSKRIGDFTVQSFRERGFLPEALSNSVALLGWSPPAHEDPSALARDYSEFRRYEVLTFEELKASVKISFHLQTGENALQLMFLLSGHVV